jgi:hypothetical protein
VATQRLVQQLASVDARAIGPRLYLGALVVVDPETEHRHTDIQLALRLSATARKGMQPTLNL